MHNQTLSPERRRVANDILSRLSPYEPDKVILFGSYARNESDELSDIDLVVIKETQDDFFTRIHKVMQILDFRTAIDILVYTPSEIQSMKERGNAFIETVFDEGILLHG